MENQFKLLLDEDFIKNVKNANTKKGRLSLSKIG